MPFNHCFCMFYTRFPLICFGGVVLFACISNVFRTVCVTSFQTCFLLVFPLISNVVACLWSFVFACFSDVSNVRVRMSVKQYLQTFSKLRSQLFQAYFRAACQAFVCAYISDVSVSVARCFKHLHAPVFIVCLPRLSHG